MLDHPLLCLLGILQRRPGRRDAILSTDGKEDRRLDVFGFGAWVLEQDLDAKARGDLVVEETVLVLLRDEVEVPVFGVGAVREGGCERGRG